jgi:hypothetical protein
MSKSLEFLVALAVSAFCWLWAFPMIGATTANLAPWILSSVIVGHATLSTFLFQFFYAAEILIGDRYKPALVTICLLLAEFGIPMAGAALVGYVTPGLVVSYGWLLGGVAVAVIATCVGIAMLGPVRKHLEHLQMLKAVTLIVDERNAYLPVVRDMKVEKDKQLLIPHKDLLRVNAMVVASMNACLDGDWERGEPLLLDAIPELEACGSLGILRLIAACIVMRQSCLHYEQEEMAAYYNNCVVELCALYKARGPY